MSDPQPPVIKELSGRIGKYEILRPLGKGAMGMVYLAHDTRLDRDVALKVMVANIADDPELKQRFEREAKHVARMTHPNIVTVFDYDYHTDGSPYIAMELLKGKDLQKAVRQPPPLTLERKVFIIVQVLSGLVRAHQEGIIHRDIKPSNIWLQDDGSVKIMDFGVARDTAGSMTGTGNIVGTADYMSPEQVKGAKVDGRSDVFAVGCMLYELLAGRRPFHSDNLMAIFYKITHEEPNYDLIPAGPDYDALLPILKKSLAKNLEERYQTAYQFAVELREYLKTHATSPAGQHVLESLADLGPAPSHPPRPLTEAAGSTLVPAQDGEVEGRAVDTGSSAGRRRVGTLAGRPLTTPGRPGTQAGADPTVVVGLGTGTGLGGTVRPGTTRLGAPAPPAAVRPPRPAARPAPAAGNPMLYVAVGGLFVALLGAGGYIYWSQQHAAPSPPPPTQPPVSAATAAPPPTLAPTPPPPTPAPPPSFAVTVGKAAASMKAAQVAFEDGNYNRAIAEAQQALRDDPGNRQAQRLVESALNGQKAESHLRNAEAALRQADYAQAGREADAARALAPWDGRVTSIIGRIRDAQQQAQLQQQQQQQRQVQQQQQSQVAQVNKLLNDGDNALASKQFDAAIKLYDEALRLDPTNVRAGSGRTGAVTARAVAEAAATAGGARASRAFVSGKTQAQSVETKAGSVPEGFEESAGVTVKRGTQAAELPGKIHFEFSPEVVKPGERYTARILLLNEGAAPIQIQDMLVTTTVNGRKSQGPVPPLAKDVAPRQKALLLSLPDIWKEDTSSWSMEVVVRTTRGETYRNQVTWK